MIPAGACIDALRGESLRSVLRRIKSLFQ